MKMKWKSIWNRLVRFQNNVQKYLGGRYFFAWITLVYCFIRFGCSPDDFFRYRFYEKSDFERNKFITYGRSKRIINKYNKKESIDVFQDKVKFNCCFHEQIKREWLDLRIAGAEEFELFVNRHQKVIMKPLNGGQGKGIFMLTAKELTNAQEVLNNNRMYLAEEVLVQHEAMANLNATSVNTIRVLTFKNQVIAAMVRTGGTGAIVDNLSSDGVVAHIDLETGIVDVPAIDNMYRRYLHHPASGMQLVGFVVPHWGMVKEMAHKVAQAIPDVEYIGWDIAILENGIALIEGNHDPGHAGIQMTAQTGLFQKIKSIEKLVSKN